MDDTIAKKLDEIIEKNFQEQIRFLQTLVQTNSANPFTPDKSIPERPIERKISLIIEDRLRSIGLKPELKGISSHRPNVVAVLSGLESKKSLILNGHMDTVMPSQQGEFDPFAGTIRENRLYGLGALDMKASLAIFVFVAKALLESRIKLAGDLILTFVVDEEPGASSKWGTRYLLKNGLKGSAAIVGEPGNRNVTIGHKGGYRFRLVTRGKATHTGLYSWERGEGGKNAILSMVQAIEALNNLEIPHHESKAFPGRKSVFTFPTLIEGGTSINVVPEECTAYGDSRLLPGIYSELMEQLIIERLDRVPNLEYSLEQLLFVPAVEISADEEIVRILQASTTEVLHKTPSTIASGPWNDGWSFIANGIPAVCGFGPEGRGIHAPDEFVYLDSFIDTTRIYARAIIDYLGIVS